MKDCHRDKEIDHSCFSSLFNVNDINTHFQSINTDINYVDPALLEIMPELHKVPVIHEISIFKVLAHVKRAATGPIDLPFWFWKEYMAWN